MNIKTLAILALITAAVVFAAMKWTSPDSQGEGEDDSHTALFLPELSAQLDTVQQISIQTASDHFSLSKQGEQWGLDSRQHYPVASSKVNALLLGLAGLSRMEEGTANPELYSHIGVEAVTEPDAKSVLVIASTAEAKPLAALLVGTSSVAKTDTTQQEIYVREPEAKQSWRVMGNIPLVRQPLDWVEKAVADINAPDIQSVTIQPATGEPIHIFKESAEQSEFSIANLPENATAKTSEINLLSGFLSNLDLEDVQAVDGLKLSEAPAFTAEFKQFDGLSVQMGVKTAENGQRYAMFTANAPAETAAPVTETVTENSDSNAVSTGTDDAASETATAEAVTDENTAAAESPATPAESKPSAAEQATTLNQRWQGWAYVLPNWKLDRIVLESKALYDLPAEDSASADSEAVIPEVMPIIPATAE